MSNGLRISSDNIPPHIARLMKDARTPTAAIAKAEQSDKAERIAEKKMHRQFADWLRLQEKAVVVVHSRMDRPTTQQNGVADFIIARHNLVLFIEMKVPGNKLSDDQRAFEGTCNAAGVPYRVCYSVEEAIKWTKNAVLNDLRNATYRRTFTNA
jgi:hypothetical protein